ANVERSGRREFDLRAAQSPRVLRVTPSRGSPPARSSSLTIGDLISTISGDSDQPQPLRRGRRGWSAAGPVLRARSSALYGVAAERVVPSLFSTSDFVSTPPERSHRSTSSSPVFGIGTTTTPSPN